MNAEGATATRRRSRGVSTMCVLAFVLASCGGSGSSEKSGDGSTVATPPASRDAAQEIAVVFDTPGSDPRPLRETDVAISVPTSSLRMRVTDLTYRGVVCGFTFTGTRPSGPVSIRVDGTTPSGGFTSGPVELRWADDGTTSADAPSSDNSWSFSADAYASRTSQGWAVSIGAVTAEGDNVVPSEVTCELRAVEPFTEENGPVGYWAGFATV